MRTPVGYKPVYIDLESATFVELLCHFAKQAEWIHLTEMLPAPEDCWLTDGVGARYASELRLVVADAT